MNKQSSPSRRQSSTSRRSRSWRWCLALFALSLSIPRAQAAAEIDYQLTTPTDPVKPGSVLEFDVTVHNLTNSAQAVRLDYNVPKYTILGCCDSQGSAEHIDFGPLAAGKSATAQLRLKVVDTNSVPEGSEITLVLNDLNRAASVTRKVVVRESPALGLALSTENDTLAPGANFTYTLSVSNISIGNVAGAVLSLPVPPGATFVSADHGGTLGNGKVTWHPGANGVLAAGANQQVHVTFKAGSGTVPLGPLEATLKDNAGHQAQASEGRVLSAAPQFQYTLTAVQDPVQPGTILEYDVTVHNLTGSSQTVRLDYSVPQYTILGCCDGEGEAEHLDFGTIAAGQSETAQVRLNVLEAGSLPEGATITLHLFDLERATSVARSVVVRQAPVLALNLATENGTVTSATNFTYSLNVSNVSLGDAPGAVLTVAVPDGATFVTADGSNTFSGGVVTWPLGALAAGENQQRHITFKAGAGTTLGPLDAVVTDGSGNVARASDARLVTATPRIQYLVTAVPDPVQPSEVAEFDVTVHNLTNTAQSVTLDYSVPQYTRFACCDVQGAAENLNFGIVGPGQYSTAQVRLKVPDPGSVPEGATITLQLFDLARAASVSRSIVVREAPVLDLDVSTQNGTVAPGANFTYALNAANIGLDSLIGTVLVAAVPAGATFVSADGGGSFAGGLVTWHLGSLGAGANEQLHLTLKAGSGTQPLAPVNAIFSDAAGHVARVSNNRVIIAAPLFQYTVTAPDAVEPGTVLEFDVTVHNLTNSSQSVRLDWTVPEYAVFACCDGQGSAERSDFGTVGAGKSVTTKISLNVGDNDSAPEGASITLELFDLARGASVSKTVTIRSNVPSVPATPHFANIATRMTVGTGDNVLIAGFIVTGAQSKRVLLRGIGPSLTKFGIAGALANPTLTFYDATNHPIANNDNWKNSPDKQAIANTGIAPTNDAESAILVSVAPGTYTAILAGVGSSTGIGVIEVYDLNPAANAELANISSRGQVGAGDNVMIGGIIIHSGQPTKIVVRALGPSLPVSNPLADPTLELHNGNGATLFSNNNWREKQETAIEATGLAPGSDAESAIVATLPAGSYTAVVRGANNSTGVAVVDAYDLQ